MAQNQKIGLLFQDDLLEHFQDSPAPDDLLRGHSLGLSELLGVVQDMARRDARVRLPPDPSTCPPTLPLRKPMSTA